MFSIRPRHVLAAEVSTVDNGSSSATPDIEDLGSNKDKNTTKPVVITQKNGKRKYGQISDSGQSDSSSSGSWRDILGPPPKYSTVKSEFKEWLAYHKRKWQLQLQARRQSRKEAGNLQSKTSSTSTTSSSINITRSISDFVQKSASSKATRPWQVLGIVETNKNGSSSRFKMWILVDTDLYSVNLNIQRTFYVNQIKPAEKESSLCRKCTSKHLPRSQAVYNLYEYRMPEEVFQKHQNEIMSEFSNANVEGVYELNVPLMFRSLIKLGCVCSLKKEIKFKGFDSFDIDELEMRNDVNYMENSAVKTIYLFIHFNSTKMIVGSFQSATKNAHVFVLDTIRNNSMPNLNNLLNTEKEKRVNSGIQEQFLPSSELTFDIKVETNESKIYKALDKVLSAYKEQKRGATMILLQSNLNDSELRQNCPTLDEFPIVRFNVTEK